MFLRNVIEDPDFRALIEKKGFLQQKDMFRRAEKLIKDPRANLAKYSRLLGALTYQHAYFVAPGICEAVASFGDRAALRAMDHYNRAWGILIPGETYLEGYGNKKWQTGWAKALPDRKCLLIRKSAFNRREFFSASE